MSRRMIRTASALILSALGIVLFALATGLLTQSEPAAAQVNRAEPASDAEIVARRAISIPFGIADTQQLSEDGTRLTVTGHAVCWDEGQMFDLRVRIAQSTTQAFAVGHSIDNCQGGERQMWTAVAEIESEEPFDVGSARACAEATEYATHGIADEHKWCKDVDLAQSDSSD